MSFRPDCVGIGIYCFEYNIDAELRQTDGGQASSL